MENFTPFCLIDRLVQFPQVVLQAKYVEIDVVLEIFVGFDYQFLILLIQFVLLKNVVRKTWNVLGWFEK